MAQLYCFLGGRLDDIFSALARATGRVVVEGFTVGVWRQAYRFRAQQYQIQPETHFTHEISTKPMVESWPEKRTGTSHED